MIYSLLLLLAVLLVAGAIFTAVLAYLIAQSILRPPRMSDGKAVYVLGRLAPGDLGLQYTVVTFPVRDSAHPSGPALDLAAWWIPAPAPSHNCVVLIHGYADAKVGSIAWAPAWQSIGFNICAIDLRAHGESCGDQCTAGFYERHDLNELLDRLRSLYPSETQKLILFGASMGAAVALATAEMRDDLTALVLDSPFADYRTAVLKHLDRIGLPAGPISKLAIWLAQIISAANFARVRPLELLPKIACPVLLIRGELDDFLTPEESDSFTRIMTQRAASFPDENWVLPGVTHLGTLQNDPPAYAQKLGKFVERLSDPRELTEKRDPRMNTNEHE
jgi:pimeloyl-ACP methyl ester carboxylesterase